MLQFLFILCLSLAVIIKGDGCNMLKERLDLKHRDILNSRLALLNTELSEYSFANLYLFRDVHDYHVIEDDGTIWICGKTRTGESYAMPTDDIRNMSRDSIRRIFRECSTLFPVPEEWLSCLDPSEYDFTYNDGIRITCTGQKSWPPTAGSRCIKRKTCSTSF
jgi:hypothetical protein